MNGITKQPSKYRIAWLPGDGIGVDVLDATKIVLDKLKLNAEYIHGDIGWDFWCREGDALPERTIHLLQHRSQSGLLSRNCHLSCREKA